MDAFELDAGEVVGVVEKAKPVGGFAGFFVGDGYFVEEVFPRTSSDGFFDICANAGATSEELLGQDKFSFLAGEMLVEFDDPQGEFIGFDLGSVIVLHFEIRNSPPNS